MPLLEYINPKIKSQIRSRDYFFAVQLTAVVAWNPI